MLQLFLQEMMLLELILLERILPERILPERILPERILLERILPELSVLELSVLELSVLEVNLRDSMRNAGSASATGLTPATLPETKGNGAGLQQGRRGESRVHDALRFCSIELRCLLLIT